MLFHCWIEVVAGIGLVATDAVHVRTAWPSRAQFHARGRRLRGADSTGRPLRRRWLRRHDIRRHDIDTTE